MISRTCLLSLVACSVLAADEFEVKHESLVAGNPPGVRLQVRLAEPRAAYRVGERIALTLSFASDRAETYRLNGALYDRGGRLEVDRFIVDRNETVEDPLAWYFGSGVGFGLSGGLRGYPELTVEPKEIEADLNEWLRFEEPGRYRLYVVSERVGRIQPRAGASGPLPVASEILDFEILPRDTKGDAASLSAAAATIAAAEEKENPWPIPMPLPPDEENKLKSAIRTLRFLGTDAGVDALLDAYGVAPSQYDGDIGFALAASGRLPYLRERLLAVLQDPAYSLPQPLLHLLIAMDIAREFPKRLPWKQAEMTQEAVAEAERRQARSRQIGADYARTLVRLLPTKTMAARKADFAVIESYLPDEAERLRPLTEDPVPSSAAFLAMSVDEQTSWLYGSQWERLRETNILPALLELLPTLRTERSLDPTALRKFVAWTTTLERIALLDPEKGRSLILEDLTRESPMANLRSMASVLPDGVYPEIDEPTIARLEKKATSSDAAILARYASAAVADRALAVYQSTYPASCDLEVHLLAYLVRTRPAEGADLVEQALGDRESRGCWRDLLGRLGQLAWSPQLEAIALGQLDDPEPGAARNAALALGHHREPATREAIWKRLEASGGDKALAASLQQALRCAPGKLMSDSERVRLSKVCPECRLRKDDAPVVLSLGKGTAVDREWTIRLDNCLLGSPAELIERLKLYPAGTLVEWIRFGLIDAGEEDALFERIQAGAGGVVLRRGQSQGTVP